MFTVLLGTELLVMTRDCTPDGVPGGMVTLSWLRPT